MVESCPKDSPGQQTLLEAAKAVASLKGWSEAFIEMRNLRAAIAREEAKQASLQDDAGRYAYWKGKATRYESERDTCYSDYQKEAARAQQAEASAAWHKAESERLSAELAKERASYRSDSSLVKALRERAEKAEAECCEQRARAESGEDRNRDLSEKLIAAHGKTHAESERAKKAESDLAKERATSSQFLAEIGAAAGRKFNEPITQTIENLRQRAELAESMLAKPQQSHPMDGGDITVMLNRAGVKAWRDAFVNMTTPERVEWLIGDWRKAEAEAVLWKARADEAETAVASHCGALPAFEGDPKACAFIGIVRDPVTGWTFGTMRQQFDAARTTVRVLAAELVAARQQIAVTKGFEA